MPFYRHINKYDKRKEDGSILLKKKTNKVFNMFKELFIIIFILRMFDPLFRTRLKTDVSGFAIRAIISQLFYDLMYKRDN
jgi:hypothetical protein